MGSAAAPYAWYMLDGGVDAANFALKVALRTQHDCITTQARRKSTMACPKISHLACSHTSWTAGWTARGVGGVGGSKEDRGQKGGSVGHAEPTHPSAVASEKGRHRPVYKKPSSSRSFGFMAMCSSICGFRFRWRYVLRPI